MYQATINGFVLALLIVTFALGWMVIRQEDRHVAWLEEQRADYKAEALDSRALRMRVDRIDADLDGFRTAAGKRR